MSRSAIGSKGSENRRHVAQPKIAANVIQKMSLHITLPFARVSFVFTMPLPARLIPPSARRAAQLRREPGVIPSRAGEDQPRVSCRSPARQKALPADQLRFRRQGSPLPFLRAHADRKSTRLNSSHVSESRM